LTGRGVGFEFRRVEQQSTRGIMSGGHGECARDRSCLYLWLRSNRAACGRQLAMFCTDADL
jgi:hypothetical protein